MRFRIIIVDRQRGPEFLATLHYTPALVPAVNNGSRVNAQRD